MTSPTLDVPIQTLYYCFQRHSHTRARTSNRGMAFDYRKLRRYHYNQKRSFFPFVARLEDILGTDPPQPFHKIDALRVNFTVTAFHECSPLIQLITTESVSGVSGKSMHVARNSVLRRRRHKSRPRPLPPRSSVPSRTSTVKRDGSDLLRAVSSERTGWTNLLFIYV